MTRSTNKRRWMPYTGQIKKEGFCIFTVHKYCLTIRPRCAMYMIISDDDASLLHYLRMRQKHGLFNKLRKHMFVTTEPPVKNVIYGIEEFQYHAHTG